MRNALLKDLRPYPLAVSLDPRIPLPDGFHGIKVFVFDTSVAPEDRLRQAFDWADGVWLVAPETGGILENLKRQVTASGKGSLGSTSEAIALTADKYRTIRYLQSLSFECVPCWTLGEFELQVPPPWVVKPLDGVGCEGTCVTSQLPVETEQNVIIQPFVEGESLSLSALFDSGKSVLLSVNRQIIERREGRFHLLGCQVNALSDEDGRFQRLCDRIAAAIPGLWGYAGVDLILHQDRALILEINPRLTLSYTGLSRALGTSVAAMVIEIAKGERTMAEVASWRRGLQGQSVWVTAQ